MKKSKGEQIELLYSKPGKKKSTGKSKNDARVANSGPKKKTQKKNMSKKRDKINLDNEIIIGITPKKEEKKKQTKKIKTNKNKKRGKADVDRTASTSRKTPTKKTQKKKTKNKKIDTQKRKIRLEILKWTSIIIVLITTIILFMLSSVFNIKNIIVINNKKISNEEIINLSGIKKDENMFKLNLWEIENNIKKNPYVAELNIKRHLNGTIDINIEERETTYMLAFANNYVYINNQGYMLEISQEKLSVPMLTGFKTEIKNIEPGKRLEEEDLLRLGTVIKIVECAKANDISHLVTSIDISNDQDYTLVLEAEKKTIHFGDSSKINQKVMWIIGCIEREKGIEGELFVRNINKPYFREKV